MFNYLKDVRKEAEKIIFSEKDEVYRNTGIVLGVSTASSLLLWGISEAVLLLLQLIV